MRSVYASSSIDTFNVNPPIHLFSGQTIMMSVEISQLAWTQVYLTPSPLKGSIEIEDTLVWGMISGNGTMLRYFQYTAPLVGIDDTGTWQTPCVHYHPPSVVVVPCLN
jgi:hypothetical protein